MRLTLAALRIPGANPRQLRVALVVTGIAVAWPCGGFVAKAEDASTIDRLHFSINQAEPSFADGGPAFVSPATALTGLNPPTIREAYLRRELAHIEDSLTSLALQRIENPADQEVAQKLDSTRRLVSRLRKELGISARGRQTPAPLPQVPSDGRLVMSGDDGQMLLRLRSAATTASSVALRNIDGDERGQIVTGTQAVEFQPSGRTTVGLFGRSSVGEAWTSDALDRAVSAGLSVGGASSVELDRNITLSGAVLYGRSWTEAIVADDSVGFSGDELVADARLDNRSWYGSWLFVPGISAHYEQAIRGSYTDSVGDRVDAEGRRLGRISATNEISRSYVDLSGDKVVTYHPFVRAGANLDVESPESSGADPAADFAKGSALVGGGLRVYSGQKSSIMFSEEYHRDDDGGTFRFVTQMETPFGRHGNGEQPGTLNLSADADHTGAINARVQATVRFR